MNKMSIHNFFIGIDELMILEQQKKWLDTLDLLENMIAANDELVEYLTRYLAQCCFLLNEWNFLKIGNDSEFLFVKRKIIEFLKKYINVGDYKYRFIYGYFGSLNPNLFTYNPEEEYKIEIESKMILREIYESDRDNLIYVYIV